MTHFPETFGASLENRKPHPATKEQLSEQVCPSSAAAPPQRLLHLVYASLESITGNQSGPIRATDVLRRS